MTTVDIREAKSSQLFLGWRDKVQREFNLGAVEIQSVDWIERDGERKPLFIKLKAEITDQAGQSLPGIVFLRGESVAIFMVIESQEKEYVLLVEQARPAIGVANYWELPAGMVENESVSSAALRELAEETGITVEAEELIDLAEHFYGGIRRGVYPSPGACDELVSLQYCRKTVTPELLEELKARMTNNIDEREHIKLILLPLEVVCRATSCQKVHSAFLMYQYLMKERTVTIGN